jgi:Na+/proline symporter
MAVAIFVIQSPSLVAASVVHQVITVAGFSSGLIVGIFFLGKTRRQYAQRSGLIGMCAALVVTTVLIFPPADSPWKVHGWWAAAIASCVCFAVAAIVDRMFPERNENL